MYISNIAFIQAKEFKPCIKWLDNLKRSPEDLLTTEMDAFGQGIRGMEDDLRQLEETNKKVWWDNGQQWQQNLSLL